MARISIDEIKSSLSADGWTLVSEKYKNLDSNLEYRCDKGHVVTAPWREIRKRRFCPICAQDGVKIKGKINKKKPHEYRILALDQATHITGYSVYSNRKLLDSGVFEAKAKDEITRCMLVRQWLISMIQQYEVDMVGLEQIQLDIPKSPLTFEVLAHLQGILMLTCLEQNIPYKCVHVSVWRSHCGVKGKSREVQKSNMQAIVQKWYGFKPSNDEADAIGIGRYLSDMMAPKMEIIDWENE